jgi:hypothetical protein
VYLPSSVSPITASCPCRARPGGELNAARAPG